jgi:hypothetical protein
MKNALVVLLLLCLAVVFCACHDPVIVHESAPTPTSPPPAVPESRDPPQQTPQGTRSPQDIVGQWKIASFDEGYGPVVGNEILEYFQWDDFYGSEYFLSVWDFLPNGEFRIILTGFHADEWGIPYSAGRWAHTGEDALGNIVFDISGNFKGLEMYEVTTVPLIMGDMLHLVIEEDGFRLEIAFERVRPPAELQTIVGVWDLDFAFIDGVAYGVDDPMIAGVTLTFIFLQDGSVFFLYDWGEWRPTGRSSDGNLTYEAVFYHYPVHFEERVWTFELTRNGDLIWDEDADYEGFIVLRRVW